MELSPILSPTDRRYQQVVSTALATCLALAGCNSTDTATPTGTSLPPMAVITETLLPATTPAPTETPNPTIVTDPTDRPTNTPAPTGVAITPTATSYPQPAVPLSPAGPWLLFRSDDYLWAMNQDGTGVTRLTNERICMFSIRPNGTVQSGLDIAYSTSLDGECRSYYRNVSHPGALKLLSLPGKTVKTLVYDLSRGVQDLEWSPSGSKLAFVGALGDASGNVFVYDFAVNDAVRIAVTQDDDYITGWSEDERYVIHAVTVSGGMGFTATRGIWSSRADASAATQLVGSPDQWIEYAGVIGWNSPTEVIVTLRQWTGSASSTEARIINIETGASATLFSDSVLDYDYSPEHNMFLTTKETTPAPNRLLIFHRENGETQEISGYRIKEVKWLSAYDAFLGQTPDGLTYLISPDGTVTEIPTPKWETFDSRFENDHAVIVSPDSQWWVWFNDHWNTDSSAYELWAGPAKAQPSVRIATSLGTDRGGTLNPYYIRWSPDSRYVLWESHQSAFIARAPEFAATQIWAAASEESQFQGWRFSLDGQSLYLFTDQGIFIATPPESAPVQISPLVGTGGGIWVK